MRVDAQEEAQEGPAEPIASTHDVRGELAARYLRGSGVEIGALHLATALSPGVRARYVDRMNVPDLRHHYPELRDWDIAHVDIVDDGERLLTVPDGSVDFIVANHFLEHCQDPITTITTHLGKLRPGGTLFYAVPDKRYTFDFRRDRTPLQHIIDDHEHGPERSRTAHYLQWTSCVHEGPAPNPEEAAAEARRLETEDYSIHFHVWTAADLTHLILHIQQRLDSFEIETIRRNGIENILVLRRHGDPAADTAPSTGEAPAPAPIAARATRATFRTPLAGLRVQLDDDEAACEWSLDPDGAAGRALIMPSGRGVTFPLRLAEAMRFTARVRLLPHDWRDGRGTVFARVFVTDVSGERELESAAVGTNEALGDFDGVQIECEVPVEASSLRLVLAPHLPGERAVARAIWVEPALLGGIGARPAEPAIGAATPMTELARSLSTAAPDTGRPRISVLMPVHDPALHMLHESVESVLAQSFESWELCLVDDGSRHPEVISTLERYAGADPRIRLERREQGGGISDATNAALAIARGEFVALLDHDDWLSPDALGALAARIAREPDLDMLYTDEDIVLDGTPVWVHLKPGWSPDTMRTNGYTCHLGAYRRTLVDEVGGFRSAFDGSQDVDMILRLIERSDRVAHVPGVHYHWRIHPDSTAGGDAKPYAYVAARRAIAEHLDRSEIAARVDYGPPGLYRVVHEVPVDTSVTVVLALEDTSGISDAAAALAAQPHPSWEIMLAGPHAVLADAMFELRRGGVANHRIRSIVCEDGDRHAALDRAARAATGDRLVLMQTPAAPLSEDWLTRLVGYAGQDGIAAAGPVLLGENGRIQDAGVVIPDGWPLPLLHGTRSSMDDHFGYGTSVYDVSAVSGVLATSAVVFAELGGLRPKFAELSLVDYCLRAGVGAGGRRTVLVPDARLRIVGHDRTMNDLPRMEVIAANSGRRGRSDPFYNPLLREDRGDFRPR